MTSGLRHKRKLAAVNCPAWIPRSGTAKLTRMSDGPQRRLAAIVAIDVVGYSRLMGADEPGTLARLKDNRAATDPIDRYGKNTRRVRRVVQRGTSRSCPTVSCK